jgi:hypothetical protein
LAQTCKKPNHIISWKHGGIVFEPFLETDQLKIDAGPERNDDKARNR